MSKSSYMAFQTIKWSIPSALITNMSCLGRSKKSRKRRFRMSVTRWHFLILNPSIIMAADTATTVVASYDAREGTLLW